MRDKRGAKKRTKIVKVEKVGIERAKSRMRKKFEKTSEGQGGR